MCVSGGSSSCVLDLMSTDMNEEMETNEMETNEMETNEMEGINEFAPTLPMYVPTALLLAPTLPLYEFVYRKEPNWEIPLRCNESCKDNM